MISWASNIYFGKRIRKKKDKIIESINNNQVTFEVYCIVFASHPDNLFDIMDANELLFPHYKDRQFYIVGLARGKQEAYELVQGMLMEVYKKTGKFDVRTYFT